MARPLCLEVEGEKGRTLWSRQKPRSQHKRAGIATTSGLPPRTFKIPPWNPWLEAPNGGEWKGRERRRATAGLLHKFNIGITPYPKSFHTQLSFSLFLFLMLRASEYHVTVSNPIIINKMWLAVMTNGRLRRISRHARGRWLCKLSPMGFKLYVFFFFYLLPSFYPWHLFLCPISFCFMITVILIICTWRNKKKFLS